MNKETRSLVSQVHSLEPVLEPGTLVMLWRGATPLKREGGWNVGLPYPMVEYLAKNRKANGLGLKRRWSSTQEEIFLYIHITENQGQAHQCTVDACHIINGQLSFFKILHKKCALEGSCQHMQCDPIFVIFGFIFWGRFENFLKV